MDNGELDRLFGSSPRRRFVRGHRWGVADTRLYYLLGRVD